MHRSILLAVGAALAAPVLSCLGAEAAAPTELEGDWQPTSIRNGDDTLSAEDLRQLTFTFHGNRHTLTIKTETVHKTTAALRVDPRKTPKEIDLDLDEKPAHEKQPVILGIYRLEGDQLTIAYSRANRNERLKEFPAKPVPGVEIVTLVRATAATAH